ncbi:MAG: DNA/RNA non-specific endonuclease [Bacteroidales bacterium]|nr:DNA/RNA non-specific endonuclease [Bacteroidales bacterium]
MGQTGATLSGSYSGASATPTAVGFKYGTSSGNLNQTVTGTANGTSFTATLSGLTAGQTYYYKAFVTVNGTENYASQSETFYGSECHFTTAGIGTVTTGSASGLTSTGATLNASYADVQTGTHAPQDIYFKYGTSSSNLDQIAYYNDGLTNASGSFAVTVSGLSPSTKYYYKVYMSVWNGTAYQEISGDVQNFTTVAEATVSQGYLGCYEMPSVSISGTGTTGYYNTGDRDDQWYRYNTSSSNRKVVTHTFTGSKRVRNYTVLFDGDKHAPLWAAFPMHANVYGGSTSRSDDWKSDPALSSYSNWQQTGLDNAQSVGYSRGHFVASQYRKKNDASNLQTFYYSNQAPQWQNGFNSGVWSSLEDRVLAMSPSSQYDTLYVVVGVLYEGTTSTLPSGSINVPLPSHFYTCLMKCSFNENTGEVNSAQGIAFVYTNESHSGESWYKEGNGGFVTSIDEIETRTGFNFFANVPTSCQTGAEANKNHTWFTGQSSQASNVSGVSTKNWGSF